MDVFEVTQQDVGAWDAYVAQAGDRHPFLLSAWRHVMKDAYGYRDWYLAAREGDQVVGVLPLIKVSSIFLGSYVTSLPRGLCADNQAAAMALLESAQDVAAAAHARSLIIRDATHCWSDESCWCDDCTIAVRALPETREQLTGQLKRQMRQHIRKAEEAGVVTETGPENLDAFYAIFAGLMHEKGVPVLGRRFFKAVVKWLPDHVAITTARLNGDVAGAIFHLTLGDTVFSTWGGALGRYLDCRCSHALWWESLGYAIDRGYRFLDMGRSPRGAGTEQFKSRWGCACEPVYRLHIPIGKGRATDPLKDGSTGARYQIFTSLWRRLPSYVVGLVGPLLRRQLPFA